MVCLASGPRQMSRVFIIAEAGVNHNGDLDLARRLVRIAADCGADAVKFQTFRAEDLVTPDAPAADYQTRNMGATRQADMLRRLELPPAWHGELLALATELGIEFFSTPFSEEAVDLLAGLGVKRLKLPSGELTNKPLLVHAARTGLPIILSTGMGTLAEVRRAVEWVQAARVPSQRTQSDPGDLCVLHCTSNYPAPPQTLNLRAIRTLADALGLPVGYSDHSEGAVAAVAAVALGARVIEKHITFDQDAEGPDHRASMTETAFADYVRQIRMVESMMGDGIKAPHASEMNTLAVARRSVVIARDLPAGHVLGASDLLLRRPAGGIEPAHVQDLPGRVLVRAMRGGELLSWPDLRERAA